MSDTPDSSKACQRRFTDISDVCPDTITGGAGNDNLTGGAGNNQFVYTATTQGTDTITDFVVANDQFSIADAILNPGGTAPGNTYAAADFESNAAIADITVAADDDHAVLITGAQTQAQIDAAVAGQAADALVVVFNSDVGNAQLVYDADWSDAAGRVTLANMTSLTTAASIAGIDQTNFFNIA